MFIERTSVGLDVHARSVVAAAIDGVTGEVFQARLSPAYEDVVGLVGDQECKRQGRHLFE